MKKAFEKALGVDRLGTQFSALHRQLAAVANTKARYEAFLRVPILFLKAFLGVPILV